MTLDHEDDINILSYTDEQHCETATLPPTATNTEPAQCLACIDKTPNVVHYPCGHCVFCMDCYPKWKSKDVTLFDIPEDEDDDVIILDDEDHSSTDTPCPICKQVIKDSIQLFM